MARHFTEGSEAATDTEWGVAPETGYALAVPLTPGFGNSPDR